MTMNADGPFVFMETLPEGSAYAVTVTNQPEGNSQQECVVENDSGTIGPEHVRDVIVSCHTDADWIFRNGFELNAEP